MITVRDLPDTFRAAAVLPRLLAILGQVETEAPVDALYSYSWSCLGLAERSVACVDLRLHGEAAMVRVLLRGEGRGGDGYVEVYRGYPGTYRLALGADSYTKLAPGVSDSDLRALLTAKLTAAPSATWP